MGLFGATPSCTVTATTGVISGRWYGSRDRVPLSVRMLDKTVCGAGQVDIDDDDDEARDVE